MYKFFYNPFFLCLVALVSPISAHAQDVSSDVPPTLQDTIPHCGNLKKEGPICAQAAPGRLDEITVQRAIKRLKESQRIKKADSQQTIQEKITQEYRLNCAKTGWVPDCLEVAGYKCFKHDPFSQHKMICRSPNKEGPSFHLTYNEKLTYWTIQVVTDP